MTKLFALVLIVTGQTGIGITDDLRFYALSECEVAAQLVKNSAATDTTVRYACVPDVAIEEKPGQGPKDVPLPQARPK